VVEPTHQGLSPRTGVHICLGIFQDLTNVIPVVGDMLVDCKASVVTSSISRICELSLSRGAHRGRVVCMCSYERVCMRVCECLHL
jgi:hypothetical protein